MNSTGSSPEQLEELDRYVTDEHYGFETFCFAEDSLTAQILLGDKDTISASHIYTRHDGLGFCVLIFVSTSSIEPVEWELRFNPMLPPQWGASIDDFTERFGFVVGWDDGDEWSMRGTGRTRLITAGQPAIVGYRILDEHILIENLDTTGLTIRISDTTTLLGTGPSFALSIAVMSASPYPRPWATIFSMEPYLKHTKNLVATFHGVLATEIDSGEYHLQGTAGRELIDSSRNLEIVNAITLTKESHGQ